LIDLLALSRHIAGDTAREPELGRAAVAWTYVNRAGEALRHRRRHGLPHPVFGDGSLRGACPPPAPPDLSGIRQRLSDPALCRALATACLISCRGVAGPPGGATHYHHHAELPPWSARLTPVALIGSYLFYRSAARRRS